MKSKKNTTARDLRLIKKQLELNNSKIGRLIKQMAKTRSELGTQLAALAAAVQALVDKINAGQDFQAEFDSVQAAIDSLNTAAAGL